jgi:3-phenylpropionate/cinnamic acid dioxygenase small subunit
MSAEAHIRDLMNRYCFAIDSGDFKTFQRLFEHAQWIAEGQTPGPEAANNLILYADGTPRTKHVISNISIEVDDEHNAASAHSYVTVYQATDDFPLQAIFAGKSDIRSSAICLDTYGFPP